MILEQLHDHWRGDVIGQVRADGDVHTVKFLCDQPVQIQLQHVGVHDLEVIVFCERFIQYRQKPAVELHGDNLFGSFEQLAGQHADTGADLQHAGMLPLDGGFRHARTHGGIDQEILPQRLGEGEAVAGEDIPDNAYICESFHARVRSPFGYLFLKRPSTALPSPSVIPSTTATAQPAIQKSSSISSPLI